MLRVPIRGVLLLSSEMETSHDFCGPECVVRVSLYLDSPIKNLFNLR